MEIKIDYLPRLRLWLMNANHQTAGQHCNVCIVIIAVERSSWWPGACILITYLHFETTITQNIPGLLCVKRLGADWRADAAITANESCEDAAPDNWTFMELGHKNCRDYWWWWLGTRAQTNLREVWSFTITDKLGPYPSWKQLLALLHLSVESIDRHINMACGISRHFQGTL